MAREQSISANYTTTLDNPVLSEAFEQDVEDERLRRIKVYVVSMAVVICVVVQRNFGFSQLCLMVSKNLHDRMFRGIACAPMSFFNTNSSGRILNRFTKDIDAIDTILPMSMFEAISVCYKVAEIKF